MKLHMYVYDQYVCHPVYVLYVNEAQDSGMTIWEVI